MKLLSSIAMPFNTKNNLNKTLNVVILGCIRFLLFFEKKSVFQVRDLDLCAKVINLAHQKYNRINVIIPKQLT